jgi:hypothetical protein
MNKNKNGFWDLLDGFKVGDEANETDETDSSA